MVSILRTSRLKLHFLWHPLYVYTYILYYIWKMRLFQGWAGHVEELEFSRMAGLFYPIDWYISLCTPNWACRYGNIFIWLYFLKSYQYYCTVFLFFHTRPLIPTLSYKKEWIPYCHIDCIMLFFSSFCSDTGKCYGTNENDYDST